MTQWADLDPKTRMWISAFIVIVIALIILAWFGYFTGAWEGDGYGH